jgi:DNA-binding protein H-NS
MAPTLKDLLAQKAELERQIAQTQRAERDEAIARVKALMAEHGLSLADLGVKAASPARGGAGAGTKVPPKYRDPATGNTWSGRGLKPTWLAAALAAGKSLDDFAL